MAEIRQMLLAEPACCLVTLVGPGGIGKTRLAIETARGINFSHGVWFVPLLGYRLLHPGWLDCYSLMAAVIHLPQFILIY